MGANFGNIQIFNKENLVKDQVVDKIVTGLKEIDYDISNDSKSDLNIKIIFNSKCNWICLYNDSLEETSIKELKKQAAFYKNIFNTDVIASHVYDSDLLIMSLDGEKRDFYVSDIEETYKEIVEYNPNASKGSIKKWSHLINNEYTEHDLKEIWSKDYILAEEKLLAIGNVLGFDTKTSKYGFKEFAYIDKAELKDYVVIELSFINKNKPYHLIYQEGLPKFKLCGCLGGIHWGSGIYHIDEHRTFAFYNKGGKSKGFDVILLGDVIDKKIVNFESIKITKNLALNYSFDDVLAETQLREVKLLDGTNILLASFNEYPIPQGFKVEYDDNIRKKLGISHSKIRDEVNALEEKIRIIFRVKGESEQTVTGKMIVLAVPHENREEYSSYECTLTNDQSYIDNYFRCELEEVIKHS